MDPRPSARRRSPAMVALQPMPAPVKRAVLEGREIPALAQHERALVVARWQRCQALGADPDGSAELEDAIVSRHTLRDARAQTEPLWRGAASIFDDFAATCANRDFVMLLAGADGVITRSLGGGAFQDEAKRLRLIEGATWGEHLRGTNAIGTALAEGNAIAVHGAAHYARVNEGLVCFAAPIRDTFGNIVGVLDATSYAECADTFDPRVVLTVARAAEEVLRARAYADASGGLDLIERLLEHAGGEAFLVERPGRIVRANTAGRPLLDSVEGQRLLPPWSELAQMAGRGRIAIADDNETSLTEVRELCVEAITDGRDHVIALLVFFAPRIAHTLVPMPQVHTLPTTGDPFGKLIGHDAALSNARDTCARLARSDLSILLLAETGSGKDLFAHAIHDASPRCDGPFVPINCGAIQPELLLSELFGHGPGAFTGAVRNGKDGKIAAADGGTLFLDEVAEMSAEAQVALLRVLEDGTYARLGETRTRTADVRVIAATCRDLRILVDHGDFRRDLFFRIGGGASVELPPLRARSDLDELVDALWSHATTPDGAAPPPLSAAARHAMRNHAWPGNVRELKSALAFAAVMSDGASEVGVEHLPPSITTAAVNPKQPPSIDIDRGLPDWRHAALVGDELDASRRVAVHAALRDAGGNISAAARRLGIARSTVYRLLRRWGDLPDTEVEA